MTDLVVGLDDVDVVRAGDAVGIARVVIIADLHKRTSIGQRLSANKHPGFGEAHGALIDIELHNTSATVSGNPDVVGATTVMVSSIVEHATSNVG